jgi:hypothetical protein
VLRIKEGYWEILEIENNVYLKNNKCRDYLSAKAENKKKIDEWCYFCVEINE